MGTVDPGHVLHDGVVGEHLDKVPLLLPTTHLHTERLAAGQGGDIVMHLFLLHPPPHGTSDCGPGGLHSQAFVHIIHCMDEQHFPFFRHSIGETCISLQ